MTYVEETIRREREWFEQSRPHVPKRICDFIDTLLYWRDLHQRVDLTQENQRLLAKLYGNPDALHDRQPRDVNVQHGKHTQTEEE
jgi:hypothetical protein